MTITTPALGIISEQDRACADMLAVVVRARGKESPLVWAYVNPDHLAGNAWKPLVDGHNFTSLRSLGCMAVFTPTGKLTTLKLFHPRARYRNGRIRLWQGKAQETIAIHPDLAKYVHQVVEAEAEARTNLRKEVRAG